MRYLFIIFIFLAAIAFPATFVKGAETLQSPAQENVEQEQEQEQAPQATEPADEEEQPKPAPQQPAQGRPAVKQPVEEEFDEGLFEDEEPVDAKKPEGTGEQPATTEEEQGLIQRKLTIDAVAMVNYTFQTGEKYTVKYHINMGGMVPADIGVIKGSAKVATDISGFLAKSSAFECILKVSITDVPYEVSFKKISDTEAEISVLLKGQISEDWESLCTFLDTSQAKFNTRGAPEQWIGTALEKATPSLNRMTVPLDPKKATNLKFTISRTSVNDSGLGTADIEGTGVVTIVPQKKAQKYENVLAE